MLVIKHIAYSCLQTRNGPFEQNKDFCSLKGTNKQEKIKGIPHVSCFLIKILGKKV